MTPTGIEPVLPPWKGDVLTAWPWSLMILPFPASCWLWKNETILPDKSGLFRLCCNLENPDHLRSPSRTRTYDTSVNSRMLYRLSYWGIFLEGLYLQNRTLIYLFLTSFWNNFLFSWLSFRPISKCQLNTLLCLHLTPIYLVVFKGSWISHLEGGFTLRCLQRLSLPDLATLP